MTVGTTECSFHTKSWQTRVFFPNGRLMVVQGLMKFQWMQRKPPCFQQNPQGVFPRRKKHQLINPYKPTYNETPYKPVSCISPIPKNMFCLVACKLWNQRSENKTSSKPRTAILIHMDPVRLPPLKSRFYVFYDVFFLVIFYTPEN